MGSELKNIANACFYVGFIILTQFIRNEKKNEQILCLKTMTKNILCFIYYKCFITSVKVKGNCGYCLLTLLSPASLT